MSHPRTSSTHPSLSNRNPLSLSDERKRDGLLRTAWMQIVSGFPCRPSPRSPWDETATGDVTPWKYLLAPMRNAVASAVVSGDKQLVDTTLEGIRGFLREVEADVCSLIPPTAEEPCLTTLAILETELEGQANPVQMAAAISKCPTAAERAIGPMRKHLSALASLVRRYEREARQPSMRVAR